MNLRHVWIIFLKEVKGIIRDKKTLAMSVALPLIFIPIINILIGGGVENLKIRQLHPLHPNLII